MTGLLLFWAGGFIPSVLVITSSYIDRYLSLPGWLDAAAILWCGLAWPWYSALMFYKAARGY